jgi:PiT family inorganic phosphate transporter
VVSIATVVATRVLAPRWAVLWAAGWNLVAFFFVGTAVANTVGQTVDSSYFGPAVVFSALLGAIVWNFTSWHLGLPTSSSHALVGGLVGAGLAAGGLAAIKGGSVEKTALFIVISPVAGLLLGGLAMTLLRLALRRADVPATEKRFRVLQLASSAAVSLAHGGNDAYWDMHDILFTNQDALGTDDLLSYAESIGIDPMVVASDLSTGAMAARVRSSACT